MGVKSEEPLDLKREDLASYLSSNHSAYMEYDGALYYLTDVNDHYWRAQDTAVLNDKGHYVDASDLVPSVSEFLAVAFLDGKTIPDVFEDAVFYASEKRE